MTSTKAKQPDPDRTQLIEEFAILDAQVENFKPIIFRHQKLRQLILDWYPHIPPEQEVTAAGLTVDVLISARDKERTVTPEGKRALFRLWGKDDFIARITVLLKNLPDPKDPGQLYTVQALTGPRHLHVVARENP